MINLTPKREWHIAEKLSERVDLENWKEIAAAAGVDKKMIVSKDNDMALCLSLVQGTNKLGQLPDYLKAVIKYFKNDNGLGDIIAELETGYESRLDKLAKAIKNGQCILFLGPGVLIINDDDGKKPFNQKLAAHFGNLLEQKAKYYDRNQLENLNYIVQRYNKATEAGIGETGGEARRLFENFKAKGILYENVFEQLAKLQWNLIINTNADTLLGDLLNKNNKDKCLLRKYNLTSNFDNANNQGAPVDNQCLFYNLFGRFDEAASILFTDADFIRFNDKVTRFKPCLNEYVSAMFDPMKEYLFLGFDFDQWYFKILFKALNLEKEKAVSWHPGTIKFNESNIDFFEEEYKFYFVNDNIETFLKKLLDSYGRLS
jgi:SIR2-like domain